MKPLIFRRGSGVARRMDFWFGVPIVLLLGCWRVFKRGHRSRFQEGIRRIVLLQTAAIGDTILAAGVVESLKTRYVDAEIKVAAGPSNYLVASHLYGDSSVVKLNVYKPWSAISALRRMRPDLVVDFGPWPRLNAICAVLSGASWVVGFKTDGQYRHYAYDVAIKHDRSAHESENLLALVRGAGGATEVGWVQPRLSFVGTGDSSDRYGGSVIFHIYGGGSASRAKEWPEAYWMDLGAMLSRAGFKIAMTGTRSDHLRMAGVVDGMRARGVHCDLVDSQDGFGETIRALAAAKAVVSVDTGIAHLAAVVGKGVVVLYGPAHPARWGVKGSNCRFLCARGEIGYLYLGFETPKAAGCDMATISVHSVFDEVMDLVGHGNGMIKEEYLYG